MSLNSVAPFDSLTFSQSAWPILRRWVRQQATIQRWQPSMRELQMTRGRHGKLGRYSFEKLTGFIFSPGWKRRKDKLVKTLRVDNRLTPRQQTFQRLFFFRPQD